MAENASCREQLAKRWTLRASVDSAPLWLLIALIVLTLSTFSPSLSGPFMTWDDLVNFVENTRFRGLGRANLAWAWTTHLNGVYQPLAWMLFGLEHVLFGEDPWSFHLVALALHAATGALLFLTLLAILRRIDPARAAAEPLGLHAGAALGAATWALHPFRAEVTGWISSQPYAACGLLYLAGILAYLRSTESARRRAWLAASLGCELAALLFKAPAVSFPAALVALDVYPLRRFSGERGWRARGVWIEKLPFVLVSLGFLVEAVVAKNQVGSLTPLQSYGVLQRVGIAAYAGWFYLLRTVWPSGLSAFYPFPESLQGFTRSFMVAFIAMAGVTVVVWRARRRAPGLAVAWLAYLAMLAPNNGFIHIGMYRAADRYTYIPLMVAAAVMAGVLFHYWPRIAASALALESSLVAALLLASLVAVGARQAATWTSSELLWRNVLDHGARDNAFVHSNLGSAIVQSGDVARALPEFEEALRLEPRFVMAHENRAIALALLGRKPEAIKEFEWVIERAPDFGDAHYDLAKALRGVGQLERSEAEVKRATELRPDFAEAHFDYGNALTQHGAFVEAKREFELAVKCDPSHYEARENLALIELRDGEHTRAAEDIEVILQHRPRDAKLRSMLGLALLLQGKLDQAESEFREALRLKPDLPQALRGVREVEERRRGSINGAADPAPVPPGAPSPAAPR